MRVVVAVILLFSLSLQAQEPIAAGVENGKPFIEYKAGTAETIFGISRVYNLEPKSLAAFNSLQQNAGLKKDQLLKIPLSATNLVTNACPNCTKVVYKVQAHEGLYRIAVNFNNMGIASLKTLNGLSTDNVSIGQELVVGYLQSFVNSGSTAAADVIEQKSGTKDVIIAKNEAGKDSNKETPTKEVEPPVTIVEDPQVQVPTIQNPETNTAGSVLNKAENGKSAFEIQYNPKSTAAFTGLAAVFKSTSGWGDAKYYVLMSNVEPGTIVKITARETNRIIYAKVLGEMPVIKENEGLLLRVNDAASGALGAVEEKNMDVTVNY